jgi:hypothetical protein
MSTQQVRLTIDEVAERGTEIYETKLRPLVEQDNVDRLLAIDVTSGEYALGDTRREAVEAVRSKRPDAQIWVLRIGHVAVTSFGGGDTREKK